MKSLGKGFGLESERMVIAGSLLGNSVDRYQALPGNL